MTRVRSLLRIPLTVGVTLLACTQLVDQNQRPENAPAAPSQAAATAGHPPVLLIAGDIARCTSTRDEETARLLDSLVQVYPDATVVPLGDLVYPDGSAANFANCYGPSWGRHKARTRPVVGNHEYDASSTAQFYFDYFNGAGVTNGPAGPRGKGYYSWDAGNWHIVVLNTNSTFVSTRSGSPQDTWLKGDLAATSKPCVLGLFHHPRFASPVNTTTLPALTGYTLYPWERLYARKADLVIGGSFHSYERFGLQRPDGTPDDRGIRQLVVGTGGASGSPFPQVKRPNSEKWGNTMGVLVLELKSDSYSWRLVSIAGKDFSDQGTTRCHGAGTLEPPPDPEEPPPDPEEPPPPPPEPTAISLTVKGQLKTDGKVYNTLDWTGAQGANVNVHRNGAFLTLQVNDGHYTNSRVYSGPITYTYKVCETAETTVCSNEASVSYD